MRREAHAFCEAVVPGKLMLLGEHAVLRGHPALVCAIDRYVRVRARKLDEPMVRIQSGLGLAESGIERLALPTAFRFVEAALRGTLPELGTGLALQIESDFPPDVGFGSSAAVTVAVVASVLTLSGQPADRERVFHLALRAVREVQGRASGADVAASVYGGVLEYRASPLQIRQLAPLPGVVAVYTGRKVSTPEVIRRVDELERRYAEAVAAIFSAMGAGVRQAAKALQEGSLDEFGRLLNLNHGLMAALGLTDAEIDRITWDLRACPGILGAKISGAGLGDCVVGVGELQGEYPSPERVFRLSIDGAGLRVIAEPDS